MNERKKVAIVDYRTSNLFNIRKACEHVGLDCSIASELSDPFKFDAVVLPGVGAFGDAMSNLSRYDLIRPIKDFVSAGRPLFAICLGFQLLFSESEEFGMNKGLDIVRGLVKRIPNSNDNCRKVKVPQVGWNFIRGEKFVWENTPLRKLQSPSYMYFVHSFFASPDDASTVASTTEYCGLTYCSSISFGKIFATQFHPEKSGPKGLRILSEWASSL